MKPNEKQFEAFDKLGVSVVVDDHMTRISYNTKRGGEENVEVPINADLCQWLQDEYDDYDASYEAYLWLDDYGHGKNGAPYYMGDVLADKEEWESMLDKLAIAAFANK